MKTKTSLWLTIATLVLCIGVMTFGVYSALSANLNLNGNLGFNMHNAIVTVSATVKNLSDIPAGQNYANRIDRQIERTIMGGESTTQASISLGDMYFFQYNTSSVYDIVIEVSFTNLSQTAIQATIPAPTVGEGVTLVTDSASGYNSFPITDAVIGKINTVKFALRLNSLDALSSNVDFSWTGITFDEYDKTIPTTVNDEVQGLIYTLNDDNESWTVKGDWQSGDKVAESVDIEGNLYGFPVTVIGQYAFGDYEDGTKIKTVDIPNSVIEIGPYAFGCCKNLSQIIIPNSVIRINDSAFYNCTGVTKLVVSDSVIEVGNAAFYGIPDSLFYQENNIKYISSQTNNYLIAYDVANWTSTTYTINPLTKILAGGLFYGATNLTQIEVPINIQTVGHLAFARCSNLKNITFVSKVPPIFIGTRMFENACDDLIIYVPDDSLELYITAIGENIDSSKIKPVSQKTA